MIKNKLMLLSLILSVLLIATLANAETYTFTLRPTETVDQAIEYTNTNAEAVNITFSVKNLQLTNPSYMGKDDAITFNFADGTHNNVGTGVKIEDNLTIEVSEDAGDGDYTADINAEITSSTGTTNVVIHDLEITVQENNAPVISGVEDFELYVNGSKEVTVTVSDTDNDDLDISWSGQPTGMTFTEVADEITISWTPTTAVSETTVTITASDGFEEVVETFVASAVYSGLRVSIPDMELGGSNQQRELTTKIFTITNTGSEIINNFGVDITSNVLGFEITQTPAATLAPGESTSLQMTLDIPLNQDSGRKDIGTLTFNYGSQSEVKTVYVTTKANIDFYDDEIEYEVNNDDKDEINEGDNIDVEPDDLVTLSLRIESLIDDIEFDEDDIEVTVECDEFDYDEDKVATKTLNDDGDKTDKFEFEIEVPYDADDGKHDATITVEAEDENGAFHTIEFDFEFEVDKPRHKIRIVDMSFANDRIEAGKKAELEIEIENVGQEDEERIYIEVKNSNLGIDERFGPYDLDEEDDLTRTLTLDIPDDADAEDYIFLIEVMYDVDRETDEDFITLTVYNNNGVIPIPEPDDEEEIIVVEPQLNEPAYGEPIKNGLFGENSLTILVAILIIVIIALLVIIVIPGKKH